MILQLLRQFLNILDRCSASFCFGLSLRFPCPLPNSISSRIHSKSMFIPQITQNHNREYEHAQWQKSPYFGPRWHWALRNRNLPDLTFPVTEWDLGTRLSHANLLHALFLGVNWVMWPANARAFSHPSHFLRENALGTRLVLWTHFNYILTQSICLIFYQ